MVGEVKAWPDYFMENKLQQLVPLISVVMPVYNSAAYLSEAIESVLTQTLRDFELIIVYDESNDSSKEIIKLYQQNDSRVKLIYGDNKSLIGALNKGINAATGKFIARMDADDISLPERFEKQIQVLEACKADICGCHYLIINKIGKPVNAKIVPLSQSAFVMYLGCTVPFAHGSVIMRSDFIKKYSLNYGNVNSAEDYELWVRLFKENAVFINADDFLFKYRDTSNSLSKRMSKETASESSNIRRGYLLHNKDKFVEAIDNLMQQYDSLSHDERKFLLMASYIATIELRLDIFFRVLKRSQLIYVALFLFNWFKGI